MEPMEILGGNTKLPKSTVKNRINQAIRWCFTLNNWTEPEFNTIIEILNLKCKCYIIGKETGESGTPHLQGYIELLKKGRPTELKLTNRIHWECAKGNKEQNITYCSKENNFVTKDIKVKKPLKILSESMLYEYQKKIIEFIKNEPNDRSIYWFYEPDGNVGKTSLCKYLIHHFNAVLLDGKKNDILYCASENDSELYIYDIPRSYEGFVSYDAIEKIKNGLYMTGKYESKTICRNSPHLLVFANFKPETHKLSLDRWIIYKIDKHDLINE